MKLYLKVVTQHSGGSLMSFMPGTHLGLAPEDAGIDGFWPKVLASETAAVPPRL